VARWSGITCAKYSDTTGEDSFKMSEPYYPPFVRHNLTILDETVGETCANLCDEQRRRAAREFALLTEARRKGVAYGATATTGQTSKKGQQG
jgi:hypothetical protein